MFKRMVSPVVLALAAFVILVFAALLPQAPESSRTHPLLPQKVLATDCVTDPACSTSSEVVAAVYARHRTRFSSSDAEVEPKQATGWKVLAVYLTPTGGSASSDCDCDSATASITANITYNQSTNAWVASACVSTGFIVGVPPVTSADCTSFASPFVSVTAVADSTCADGGGVYNSSGYRLRIGLAESVSLDCDVDPANTSITYYPASALFQAADISPDGRRVASLCSEQTTALVRNRIQSIWVTDTGPFECLSNTNAGGIPNLTLRYKAGTAPTSTPTPSPTPTP